MDQIILFGDSITQQSFNQDLGFGFGAAILDAFARKVDVVNRGLSGYNTRQALHVLPRVLPPPEHANVRLMTLWFGANDARLPGSLGGPQQHVPMAEYLENLRLMIRHASVQAHQDIRLILVTPPPVDERKCIESDKAKYPDMPENVRRKASVAAQYAQAIRDLGNELKVPVLDVWSAMMERAGGIAHTDGPVGSLSAPRSEILQSFLRDGLHLSPEGYKVVHKEFLDLLQRVYPELLPGNLPFVLPAWDDEEAWSSMP